jgi:hypothetical protein
MTANPYRTERVRRAYVDVVGPIWMPPIQAASTYRLSDYDLENIGEFTRGLLMCGCGARMASSRGGLTTEVRPATDLHLRDSERMTGKREVIPR